LVVECGEVGADAVGVGDVEVGVEGQCLLPAAAEEPSENLRE
jgi:hypothetical protein